jgi:hypothetical protein
VGVFGVLAQGLSLIWNLEAGGHVGWILPEIMRGGTRLVTGVQS